MAWVLAGGLAVALVAVAATLRRRFVAVVVDGASMEPTLRPGERVLVRRVALDRVRLGQIVVLAMPVDMHAALPAVDNPPWLIKRVVALPGDPVPYDRVPVLRDNGDDRVPAGHLVVLGDNEARSFDSRRAGYFTADALLGVVLRKLRG